MKSVSLLLTALAVAAFSVGASAQEMDFNKVEIITEQLGPNVYMLSGSAASILRTRTQPAAGSVCWPGRTASSWWMPSMRSSPTK